MGIILFGRNPGGGVANMLAMNTKLGGKTAFIGKVGDDGFGRFLEQTLKNAGIDSAGLIKDPAYLTTLAIVDLTETGERSFSFYRRQGADLMLTWQEINRELIDNALIFHFGAVSLSGQPCRDTIHEAVRYAKSKGKIISYDPNYRPFLWPSVNEAKTQIGKLVSSADILKVSEEELLLLTGETDLEQGSRLLAEQGPAIVLVSLGPKGSFFRCARGCGLLRTYDVKTIDTTGAGDSFLGTVHFRLRGKNLESLKNIAPDELWEIVDFANAAGSLTTTKKGAIPAQPTMDEIEACRRQIPHFEM